MNENPFKEKLYHHTLPVSDDLWGRIESQLPTDRKRYPLFYFALAFLVLAAGLVIFAFALRQTQEDPRSVPQDQLPPPVTPLSELPVSYEKTNVVASLESQSLSNIKEEQDLISSDIEQVYSKSKTDNRDFNKLINTGSEKITASLNTRTGSIKSSSPAESESNINRHDARFNSPMHSAALNLESLDYLSFTSIDKLAYEERHLAEDMSAIRPDPSCYKFTAEDGKSNISVDIFSAPGFGPRSFVSTSVEDDLYIHARRETENQEYAWSAGGRVNLNLSREFAIRAGIMYEQIGDLFDYTDTLATQRSTRIDSFFAADGTFLYAETNTVLIFGTLIKKIHNRYHHLDIPLLASYELCLGRSIVMLNAGPVLNITTSSRGQILNPGFTPQHITEGESSRLDAYKNNLGVSVYVGAGALIPFNKYFSGLIEPRFLYRIKPVTKTTYPLKEHRHFAGLNLGIRYHFD